MKKVVDFLKKNWYAAELTLVCFLISVEVAPLWLAWAAIFLPALGWVVYKIAKK
jgi:uncharacterized membrane protein YjjB (DUF3815 family)